MCAARYANAAVVKVLLQAGVNKEAKDRVSS